MDSLLTRPNGENNSLCLEQSASRNFHISALPGDSYQPMITITEDICLKLDEIRNFEIVEQQFANLGVIFQNAIAIRASNPAFPAYTGELVLIKTKATENLEIFFPQTVTKFWCYITSASPVKLLAYNQQGQLLTQVQLKEANLAATCAPIPPNFPLTVTAESISRLVFCTFDGQLTLEEIGFQR